MDTSIREVMAVLEEADFVRLPRPLTVAGTEFDFEAAALGTEPSHDLVLIATDDVSPARLQRLVAGLARSLDLKASRRPVSLVLVGEFAPADRIELERYARVLPIDTSKPDRAQIERAVAVLLPLSLPTDKLVHGSDPINEVLGALGPRTTREHLALVKAAIDGPEAVREALRQFANEGAGWSDENEDADDA